MKWFAASVIFVLFAPFATALAGGAQGEIDVELLIGRTEVMHDQTARGLAVLGVGHAAPDGEQYLPADPERNQFARIQEAAVRFNNLRDMACASRVINSPLCGGERFLPPWLSAGPRPYFAQDDLLHMAQDVQDRTTPLWAAVCERAEMRTGDRNFCTIE